MNTIFSTAAGGNWPVMLTPFKSDKTIDWDDLDRLIEFYISAGSKGLFAVCQSSEMFDLSNEERLALTEYILKRVNNRIPVIATGTFPENVNEHPEFIKRVYDTGVIAVIILINLFADEGESESIWIQNVENLLKKTGDIPLGMYECPLPYHRLLQADTMAWAASSGRFFWSKDTSENIDIVRDKLNETKGSNLSLYNAHVGSLLESLHLGVFGFSGIDSNFYPALNTWLCENWEKEPEISEELQQFLSWGRLTVDIKYPLSSKEYLVLTGVLTGTTTRLQREPLNEQEMADLRTLHKKAEAWHERLGLFVENSVNK